LSNGERAVYADARGSDTLVGKKPKLRILRQPRVYDASWAATWKRRNTEAVVQVEIHLNSNQTIAGRVFAVQVHGEKSDAALLADPPVEFQHLLSTRRRGGGGHSQRKNRADDTVDYHGRWAQLGFQTMMAA
jgi:hypothetical protein